MSATRNAGALASGRLSPLLALEIPSTGRATADRDRMSRAGVGRCLAPLDGHHPEAIDLWSARLENSMAAQQRATLGL